MSLEGYPYPVAISRLSDGEMSREPQNIRAINWLLGQPGGPIVVVTPRKNVEEPSLKRLVERPGVTHWTWRGFSPGVLSGARVLYAWPDRQHLDALWQCGADAIAVIEWNEESTTEWIADAKPVQLFRDESVEPDTVAAGGEAHAQLPNGVEGILEHIADMAAGYSAGLKWNEEDKLKADMMNNPGRWEPITVEQVRRKCRDLRMRPKDVDTVAGFLQRRKEGRRFNVTSSYRDFKFNSETTK